MSIYLIKKYKEEVEKLIQYGGSRNEGAISSAFQNLLNSYCKAKSLLLIPQLEIKTKDGKTIKPDGTVKDSLRLDWGYWESKDSKDDLETEIEKKFEKGYPDSNILFEDSQTAVLYQNGLEVGRASLKEDDEKLNDLLTKFVSYERPEIHDFREAVEQFKEDLPSILEALREEIEEVSLKNTQFQKSRDAFFELCQKSINPHITPEDIREMMIQHILTEEIFLEVFSETSFHRENNIARELQRVVDTFFTGKTRKETFAKIENYYKVIRRTATDIADHHEKQKFLKVLYENFYKVYNPKAADRLGVVYTPNEIVRFMIESTDYLLHNTFNKFLGDKDVEILDPFTGTGTFITELIDYLPKDKLKFKYQNEIHCNEVVILPYYVANLNIEYTYYQKMQQYEEFKNICFVDTLDNLGFTFTTADQQLDAFGFASENTERIKRQNERKISVIISNPPYNANQLNENENNKNREYPLTDRRIKETYIKASTAQKTKMYDMYARALRWASDRLNKNGVISFISNNSFIDSKTFDGFRKEVVKEFNEIYIIDLKGDARTSGERRRREAGNVFEDQIRVGVSIYFLVRKEGKQGCDIFYNAIRDYAKSDEKKNYLIENKLVDLKFTHIIPDKNSNWINLTENDFASLIPIANKQTKLAKKKEEENAIFKLFSLGVVTARDEWVYDFDKKNLEEKVKYLIKVYNSDVKKHHGKVTKGTVKDFVDLSIKWTRAVKNDLVKGKEYQFEKNNIVRTLYRPFIKSHLYFSIELNEMPSLNKGLFIKSNKIISVNMGTPIFGVLSSNMIMDLATLKFQNGGTYCMPFHLYDDHGNKNDNITDWGLDQFRTNYRDKKIAKLDIFNYVYAVLHNPAYRKKYEQNLKREFPRIPFYNDFRWWAKRGEQLMGLHLEYEKISPLRLKRVEEKIKKDRPKCLLKADKDNGLIYIDENTCLANIPHEVWQYKLGNRSAVEWVLDQYKEKKIKDPTIREKFSNYKFADHKDFVIDLIKKVARVSVDTVKIIDEMKLKD
jgi:predicted helicase